jgi:hypothetical protein
MRKVLFVALVLVAGSAAAQDKVGPLTNDLAMKTDTMIRDGELMIVSPDGHVSTLSPSADRRKAMESAFAKNGVEIKNSVILMLRDGKLFRMDAPNSAQTQPDAQKGLSVK